MGECENRGSLDRYNGNTDVIDVSRVGLSPTMLFFQLIFPPS